MSPRIHSRLLRPKRFFLGLCMCLVYTGFFPILALGGPRPGSLAWQWFGISFPLAFGMVLAASLHEAMHRPFAMLLPGAGRHFFRSHAKAVGLLALGCATIAYAADRTLPFFTLVPIALAGLTLPLPLEAGGRWAGSRALFVIALLGGLAAAAFAAPVKIFVIAHPWLTGAGGVALTALNFILLLSPRRRRTRVLVPYTSFLTSMWSAEFERQRKVESLARAKPSKAHWNSPLRGESLVQGVRAMQYETFGGNRLSMAGGYLSAVLVILGISLATSKFNSELFARKIYALVCAPSNGHVTEQTPTFFVLLAFSQSLALPRATWLYPWSRARQARLAFVASAWQLVLGFALLIGIAIGGAWFAALRLGLTFDFDATARFMGSCTFIAAFVPFAQWGRLHQNVRQDQAMAVLCTLLPATVAMIIRAILDVSGVDLGSSGFLASCAIAVIASQALYWAALRRFYREGDLLQRGTKRQNLSLV